MMKIKAIHYQDDAATLSNYSFRNHLMHFDPDNKIVQLCARGIELEATKTEEAEALFMQAWGEATNDYEKCIAAHYVARHQPSTEEKLLWDKTALEFALKINDNHIKLYYPSLYLNIAKCYEDLADYDNGTINYQNALIYENVLPDNGYGQMIRSGIKKAIARVYEAQSISNALLTVEKK